jgi:hypothetical protein
VLVLAFSLAHISWNEYYYPGAGEPFCLTTSLAGLLTYAITAGACLLLILSRARVDWFCCQYAAPTRGAFEAPLRGACITQYFFEVLWDLYGIAAGAAMQMTSKPAAWPAAVHLPGCTVFDAPTTAMTWLLGEALAFGAGVRIALFLVSVTHRQGRGGQALGLFVVLAFVAGGAAGLGWLLNGAIATWATPLVEGYKNASVNATDA